MRSFLVLISIAAFLFMGQNGFPGQFLPVSAMPAHQWETPDIIPGIIDTSPSQYPVFIVDREGRLHLFHSQWVGEVYTIVYSRWIFGIGWTKPVDILLPPFGQANIMGGFLDDQNIVNLIFWAGDQDRANIYSIRSPISMLEKSSSWSAPELIGSSAVTAPQMAAVIGDGKGFAMVVYSGRAYGIGLYSIFSTDGGKTWSQPTIVQLTRSNNLWPYSLQMFISADGRVHALWTINNVYGNSEAIYYTRTDPDRENWEKPRIFAEAIRGESATPAIIEYQDELFVIYHNDNPTTRWMQRSSDGGETWSNPVRLFNQVGSNGAAALVIDSRNSLHMFFGNRITINDIIIHGLWHSIWLGDRWSEPEAIISGPQITSNEIGKEGFDPSYAQAVAVNDGNIIFIDWRHDPMAGPINVWYSYQQIGPVTQPVEEEPTFQPTLTTVVETSLEPIPTTEGIIETEIPDQQDNFAQSNNPLTNILIGVVPVLLIVIALFYIQWRKTYR